MLTCFQFEDLNVLEHGRSVAKWFKDLHSHLFQGTPLALSWKLPDWIYDPIIKEKLLDFDWLETYQIYHDCGKPLCRTVDENGKQHFPDHAEASRRRWLECSDGRQDAQRIANLIAMDMDIHLLRSPGLEEFCQRQEAISLLITGLCEIHANAQMFGGIDSTGFKIKWKQTDKNGRRILSRLHLTREGERINS